jgi:MoaA/NifB/PqqE/SkfB family radical SAM enzyme
MTGPLAHIRRRILEHLRPTVLTAGGRWPYWHPVAALGGLFRRLGWRSLGPDCSVLAPLHRKRAKTGRYVDVALELSFDWSQSRRYEHCVVWFEFGADDSLGSTVAATFRLERLERLETVRIRTPEPVVVATHVRLRLFPAPHCNSGRFRFVGARFVEDPPGRHPLSVIADLEALKERVRMQVGRDETECPSVCDHLPTALTLELTAACNLTCSHCSSHGEWALHKHNNKLSELGLSELEALAAEVFPSLTVISIVGRGEPLVLDETVWSRFVELLIEHRVKVAITTNGYFIQRRISEDLLPLIDNVNVSMDGLSKEVFARNRGGADVNHIWRQVDHYDDLRRRSGLCRAPRLMFAWTLKRNNVAELPGFVRKIASYDADLLTARHMIGFFERELDQSLLRADPAEVNPHLAEAYDLLEAYGIQRDCVPLLIESAPEPVFNRPEAPPVEPDRPNDDGAGQPEATSTVMMESCMFIHRMPVIMATGEVMACAVPHAAQAGRLSEADRFADIWNGETLRAIRGALHTDQEWPQCRTCHYREARVTSQWALAAAGRRYGSRQQAAFSEEALNFAPSQDKG